MLVNLCDTCHEKIDKTMIICKGFKIIIDGEKVFENVEHEFCSLYCRQKYVLNTIKGKGLDDHIKV